MKDKKPLRLDDLTTFRKAIGLGAVVVAVDDGYEYDDDVDEVADEVALTTVANELAVVDQEIAIVEAKYRAWKAAQTNDLLVKDPKLAEWKVRARLESEITFLQTKQVLAELNAVQTALRGYQSALGLSLIRG